VDRLADHSGVGVHVHVDGHGAPRRSTVRSTEGEPRFTGREAELGAIRGALQTGRVVVVHGAPGLGKSRLAKEYAHQHVEAYPGGMFFFPFDQPPPTELAKLLRDSGKPAYADESVEDRCRRALRELGSAGRALLIYDAIADERSLRNWLPYDGLDWHLIVTSTSARWARSWSTVELGPLRRGADRELAASILGDDAAADRLAAAIAAKAAGITIELCASAAAAHERLQRGRSVEDLSVELTEETSSSFESAWTLLSPQARIVLQVASSFVTPRVPASLIGSALQRIGWTQPTVDQAIDSGRDRKLAGGDSENVDVHQLVAKFVRDREPLDASIRQSLCRGLVAAARTFSEHPGDLDRRARMLAYSLRVDDWVGLTAEDSEWDVIGDAITELGQFAEALSWFERAVVEKEKGDVHGRVDPASLGASLHEAGDCYAGQGKLAEALPWFGRAVVEKEKGDVHGRVDPASVGVSLHAVGDCYVSLGKVEEALPWFESAVAETQRGDAHGRVDSESLGVSLHQVGYCYSRLGKVGEALPWFERAVDQKEKGDVHGCVDPESLGVSLHQLGDCYAKLGKVGEALPWFERAVAESEKGDAHGRVDAASLGVSLHQLGDGYAKLGRFAEALPYFERAIAAKEKGNLHGRVDFAGVGDSLRRVGDCYVSLRKADEGGVRFERAARVSPCDEP
jgi:tetratricopeptide (TPR) repeat protein